MPHHGQPVPDMDPRVLSWSGGHHAPRTMHRPPCVLSWSHGRHGPTYVLSWTRLLLMRAVGTWDTCQQSSPLSITKHHQCQQCIHYVQLLRGLCPEWLFPRSCPWGGGWPQKALSSLAGVVAFFPVISSRLSCLTQIHSLCPVIFLGSEALAGSLFGDRLAWHPVEFLGNT
jgi:hypothetical protein